MWRGGGLRGLVHCLCWLRAAVNHDRPRADPPRTLPRGKGHHRDWLDACKGGTPASANFEYGAALTEIGLLGLVAMRTQKKIYWDAKAMKATNAPEAEKFLKESYRSGWEIA